MYTVGVIGAGSISTRHLQAIAAHPDTQLCAVADIVISRAEAAAMDWGAAAYGDYRQMLEKERPYLVIINLPHGLHEECVWECASFGANILLEKPMSVSYESCCRMIEDCKKSGVLLQIGHVQRYIPENCAARQVIEKGILGKLIMVNDLRTINYFAQERPKWFFDRNLAGGGISMNYAAHSLDKLMYLTDSSVCEMYGQCTALKPGIEVDGSAQMYIHMADGSSAGICLCGYAVVPENTTMLYFTEGSIRLRTGKSIEISYGGAYEKVDTSGFAPAFISQWADFVAGVRANRILHCDGYYGASIIKLIETLYKR